MSKKLSVIIVDQFKNFRVFCQFSLQKHRLDHVYLDFLVQWFCQNFFKHLKFYWIKTIKVSICWEQSKSSKILLKASLIKFAHCKKKFSITANERIAKDVRYIYIFFFSQKIKQVSCPVFFIFHILWLQM